MAYDEVLAERVRDHLADNPEIIEKSMFGGIAFMLSGNMAVGISKDELMVRTGPDRYDDAIVKTGVRDFDMTGRRMRGWVLVAPDQLATEEDLGNWIGVGLDFAGSLPPK